MKKISVRITVSLITVLLMVTALFAALPELSVAQGEGKKTSQNQNNRQNTLKKFLDKNVKKLKKAPAQCERKSSGSVPPEVIKLMMQKCGKSLQNKINACVKNPGWHLDIQIDVKDKEKHEQFEELVCRGGCPGSGAGDSYPLKVKSDVVDVQGTAYEFVCSAACSSWQCERQAQEPAPDASQVQFAILDYQSSRTTQCGSPGACAFTVAASEKPLSFELIFSSKKGFSQNLYPLKAWFRLPPENPGGDISWGQEIPLRNLGMTCGEPSADGKTCYKTSGPIVLSGAHPGMYSITLSDKNMKVLYEGEKIVQLK